MQGAQTSPLVYCLVQATALIASQPCNYSGTTVSILDDTACAYEADEEQESRRQCQAHLNALFDSYRLLGLSLNPEKCFVLSVQGDGIRGLKYPTRASWDAAPITINGVRIPVVTPMSKLPFPTVPAPTWAWCCARGSLICRDVVPGTLMRNCSKSLGPFHLRPGSRCCFNPPSASTMRPLAGRVASPSQLGQRCTPRAWAVFSMGWPTLDLSLHRLLSKLTRACVKCFGTVMLKRQASKAMPCRVNLCIGPKNTLAWGSSLFGKFP